MQLTYHIIIDVELATQIVHPTKSITVQSKSVCERMSFIASPYIFRRVFHLYYTDFGMAHNASDTHLCAACIQHSWRRR